jgi:hypothetical protein
VPPLNLEKRADVDTPSKRGDVEEMLRSTVDLLKSYRVEATDGLLGMVQDLLFDDAAWCVRYLVADTAAWLPGRRVLVPPQVLGEPDWSNRCLPVALTKGQVEACPPLAADEPVSRRHEIAMHRYFDWNPYWGGRELLVAPDAELASSGQPGGQPSAGEDEGDALLRSAGEVTGYAIEATDGEIGHVEDLIVQTADWAIAWIAVDTRNWLPGRKVLVSPIWMREIRWADRCMALRMTRKRIEAGPVYDPSQPINREFEEQLYDYYGRPVKGA